MAIDLVATHDQQQRVLAQPYHRLEQVQLCDDIRGQRGSWVLERAWHIRLRR
jgi:hypothetical protein